MQLFKKYAELSKGITLPFYEQGASTGVPVIFLHGVTDSMRSFDLLFPHLPDSIHAFALTQRGHGDADRPANGYLATDLAGDVADFMDTVGLKSAFIVGHSMGSFAAQRYAVEYPERVLGLVLIGSFTTCRGNAGVEEFVENAISKLTDPISPEFARAFQESTFANPIPKEFLETAINESLKVPARVWKEACQGMIDTDNTADLGKIKAPALLLWGDRDAYFSRAEQEKLLRNIPDSELRVYPEIGHAPTWEIPEKVATDILAFIEKTAAEQKVSRQAV